MKGDFQMQVNNNVRLNTNYTKCGSSCGGGNTCETPKEPADSFVGGLKIGLGYTLDPLGVGIESFEQIVLNGKGINKNEYQSAFGAIAGKNHKDHSLSRYIGEGVGLVVGGAMQAATGGAIALATGLISAGTAAYGVFKTLDAPPHECGHKCDKPEGTFGEGLKAGFGIAADPFGVAVEKAESFLIDGKGIHENGVKTVADDLTVDAHKSSWNLKKAIGAAAGFVGGVLCDVATGGLLPIGTVIADIIKTGFDK